MSAPATSFPRLDRSSSCEEVQSTLGEIVMAVMQFAAHSPKPPRGSTTCSRRGDSSDLAMGR